MTTRTRGRLGVRFGADPDPTPVATPAPTAAPAPAATPAPTAAPQAVPTATAAPGVAAPLEADARIAAATANPRVAEMHARLRASKCGHGAALTDCAPCLAAALVPVQVAVTDVLIGLYETWPVHCADCPEGTLRGATHADGDVPLCADCAAAHPEAAPLPGAESYDAAEKLLRRGRHAPKPG